MKLASAVGWAMIASGCSPTGVNPTDSGAESGIDSATDSGLLAPTNLRSFESNAEGVSDACKVGDYVKAQAVLGEANSNWTILEPIAKDAGTPDMVVQTIRATLTTIATDISAMKQRACETDANLITLAVPDIFDHFIYAVPSDALRGDGVFRQLQIDSEYGDFSTADADFGAADAVWKRLKPLAAAQAPKHLDIPGSATVVADTDATMMQLQAAIAAKNATDLGTAAQAGLDEIDTIETIFK